jgi:hypothetical protein
MAKQDVLIGQTDYSVLVFIPDSSSSSGAGKTGLNNTHVDFSYTRVETGNDVVITGGITPQALTNLTDAHLDWGFKEVSSTEAPGLYRLDIHDNVFASGAWSAVVFVRDAGSNNVAPVALEFQLVGQNPQNAGQVLLRTTITGMTSQTIFTVAAGSSDNSAYWGCTYRDSRRLESPSALRWRYRGVQRHEQDRLPTGKPGGIYDCRR